PYSRSPQTISKHSVKIIATTSCQKIILAIARSVVISIKESKVSFYSSLTFFAAAYSFSFS
ncbi:MAG: hypothetical protein ACI976_003095, partial [Aureispira sp.]